MFQLILFDFDYTLADASVGIILSTHTALCEMGKPLPTEALVRSSIGMPLEDMYSYFTGSKVQEERLRFKMLFMAKADHVVTINTRFFHDAISVLTGLKQLGIRVGIVSTKYRHRIMEVLERDEIGHLVDLVVGGDDVTHHKPHPEGIFKALVHFGLPAERVLFVGDTLMDHGAAVNAGTHFMAVLNGTTTAADFLAAGVKNDQIKPSLSALMEAVRS